MKRSHPNILLIAGTGRNSGKTTLAVRIIQKFANRHDLTAVKISPHFHSSTAQSDPIVAGIHFNIYSEQETGNKKDSARMLQAGAKTAYYMEVLDTHLQEAFESLLALIPASSPVVIESPALRNLVIPGVFFILDHPQTLNKKMDVLSWAGNADQFINTGIENLSAVIDGVHFDNGEWQYRT